MGKYTPFENSYIDSKIDSHMDRVVDEVFKVIPPKNIKAIILGGGYGRGEGGILHENGEDFLFNDYDLFVITPNIPRKLSKEIDRKLLKVHKLLTKEIGIDVDFGPCKSVNFLKKAPFWLVYYELKYGHKVIYGDKRVLNYLPSWDGSNIDLEEGLKLMLNRGVALMQSRQSLLHFDTDSIEYVCRNNYKAIMAMGDALIMSEGLYNYSYLKRRMIIANLKISVNKNLLIETNLVKDYESAIDFKMNPQYPFSTQEELWNWTTLLIDKFQVIFYHLFQLYTGYEGNFAKNEYEYFVDYKLFFDKSVKCVAKNIYYWLKNRGYKNLLFRDLIRHPRVQLFKGLPFLLFNDRLREIQEIKKEISSEWEIKVDNFLNVWSMYN